MHVQGAQNFQSSGDQCHHGGRNQNVWVEGERSPWEIPSVIALQNWYVANFSHWLFLSVFCAKCSFCVMPWWVGVRDLLKKIKLLIGWDLVSHLYFLSLHTTSAQTHCPVFLPNPTSWNICGKFCCFVWN